MGATSGAQAATAERPMRADARRNYDRLLAEAGAAFAERGADDVSLEEIARRAGVGIGTLYRHFPTRQSLLESVYRGQVEALTRRSEEMLASDSPDVALAEWLAALVQFGSTKKSLSAALLATIGKQSELFSSCGQMLRESTTSLLVRAQEAGQARPDVRGPDVLRLVHGLMLACDSTPGDPEQVTRMLSMVVAGLLTEPPRPGEPTEPTEAAGPGEAAEPAGPVS
jgi:AcrR family transcriptional regulator